MSGTGGQVVPVFPVGMPNPIPATGISIPGQWVSGVFPSNGLQFVSVGITLDQDGTLIITRYLDPSGTVVQARSSTPIVALTPLLVNIGSDALPFISLQLLVINGGTVPTNVLAFAALLSP